MSPHIDASLHCDEQGNRCHNDNLQQMACNDLNITNPLVEFLKNDFLLQDDEELRSLLQKELEIIEPCFEIGPNHSLAEERRDAVDWMLGVVGCYSFSAVTAILAVNYMDRFLHSFHKVNEMKPWMSQLAAVACLSLAAKVEETHVPLLIDLQVEQCKYVFEPKTIQRMEILILTTLQWKMHPVTAHSFLEYVSRRRLDSNNSLKREFLKRCECLLLSIVSDCRFMSYLPSTLSTSIMLYVVSSLEPCIGVYHQDQLMSILGINKEKVRECCGLIQEVVSSVNYVSNNKRKFRSMIPQSPKGVVDVCFSADSSDESWELLSSTASVSSSPEPFSKKMKNQDP